MEPKKPSFEASMDRLEQIIASLEKGEVPLEGAMTLFEEGAGLLRDCTSLLDQAEQTIIALERGAGGEIVETAIEARIDHSLSEPAAEGDDGSQKG